MAMLTLLSAAPLLAKNDGGIRAGIKTNINAELFAKTTVDTTCIQNAVRQRGAALTDAFNAYNQSIVSALSIKTEAEVSAWAKASIKDRTLAVVAAEKAFTSAYNNASKKLTQAKNTAHQTYNKTALACVKKNRSSASSVSSVSSASSTSSSSSSTVACQNLSGKLTGAFTLTSPINDEGRVLSLTGTGTVNDVSVQMNGSIQGIGFVAMGRAAGDITITQGTQGTVVLHVEGPVRAGFSSLPKSYRYTVKSATGVFANAETTGTAELRFKGDVNGSFTLELGGRCED